LPDASAGTGRIIAITGATGVIGRHLCRHFLRAGWTVRALVRNPAAIEPSGIAGFRLDLPDVVDADAFRGADVVVHAAWATRGESEDVARRTNEDGTMRVVEAARSSGVRRLIFISSLSARADAGSYYGRSKKRIEDRLDAARDLVIRPGLVLAADGGLASRLWRSIATTHVAPLIGGGRQLVQTVHVDDLCAAIDRAISLDLTGVLNIAEPDGILMRELLAALASSIHARCLTVRIPVRAGALALRAVEALGMRLPVTSDNLRGLIGMRYIAAVADAGWLGVRIRAARESIADLAPEFLAMTTRAP